MEEAATREGVIESIATEIAVSRHEETRTRMHPHKAGPFVSSGRDRECVQLYVLIKIGTPRCPDVGSEEMEMTG